jgi:hypothetical protein
MQIPAPLFLAFVITGMILTTGCTQGTAPAVTATPVPAAAPDLRALALDPADLPACFSLSEEQVKTPGDVGSLARDLGWQEGYVVTFTCPAQGTGEPTVILHSLAVYPVNNIPGIVAMVDSQDRSGSGLVYENLTFPGREAEMRGFYGRAGSGKAGNASTGSSPVTGAQAGSGNRTTTRSDMAEIIISRGTTFEVLRMNGPMTNATLLGELARAALAKVS